MNELNNISQQLHDWQQLNSTIEKALEESSVSDTDVDESLFKKISSYLGFSKLEKKEITETTHDKLIEKILQIQKPIMNDFILMQEKISKISETDSLENINEIKKDLNKLDKTIQILQKKLIPLEGKIVLRDLEINQIYEKICREEEKVELIKVLKECEPLSEGSSIKVPTIFLKDVPRLEYIIERKHFVHSDEASEVYQEIALIVGEEAAKTLTGFMHQGMGFTLAEKIMMNENCSPNGKNITIELKVKDSKVEIIFKSLFSLVDFETSQEKDVCIFGKKTITIPLNDLQKIDIQNLKVFEKLSEPIKKDDEKIMEYFEEF